MMNDETLTTQLKAWQAGNPHAQQRALAMVFDQIKAQCRRQRRQQSYCALQTTELANEAYLRLAQQQHSSWQNRAHFFAICARMIRRVIVDQQRQQQSLKRGGNQQILSYDEELLAIKAPERYPDWLTLDEKLTELARLDETAVRVVELKVITGLKAVEIANALNVCRETVLRKWKFARAWLRHELADLPVT